MSIKKIVVVGLFIVFAVGVSCKKGTPSQPIQPNDTTVVKDTLTVYNDTTPTNGAFEILLSAPPSMNGIINDGPTPSSEIFTEIMESGVCKLYKRVIPFCEQSCPGTALCVADDSCQPFPNIITVGTVTVNGLKLSDGRTSFTIDPIGGNYVPLDSVRLTYPPCNEGAVATLSAAGSDQLAAFTISFKGIAPLKVLNDTAQIPFPDHQDITVNWVPPTIPGISKILVEVDISYHGGTKAKIDADCPDNGSLTIPAQMLDSLKTFGISGFPRIVITRSATGANNTAKVKVTMESIVTLGLAIPGVISCSQKIPCPDSQSCGDDERCRPNQ